MRICIVAEGSYPYVMGGVSSWIQMLVKEMPEHEFIIYTIGAYEKDKGKFKYDIPQNVIKIKETFLDLYLKEKGEGNKRYNITSEERRALKGLMAGEGEDFQWKYLFDFIDKYKSNSVSDFLMSKDFFDMTREISEEKYNHIVFNDFFWTIRSMILTLFQVIRADIPKADIYHSVSTGYAGIVAALGKHKYGSPMILTEHGIYTREREEEIIKSDWVNGYFKDIWINYFHNLSKFAYQYSNIVVSLFERNREIQIDLGCDAEKTIIIPNGVSYKKYKNVDTLKEEKETIYVGSIVRIVPIKDIKTIIQGFAIAAEEIQDIKLFIMGPSEEDEDYYKECKELVHSLNLKNVIFTGQVVITDYIGKMDILVLGSISEGQPLAVLEGMVAGKPHILTDVGGCRELMEGVHDEFGQAGIVVPVMDYEAIGQSIIKLSRNKSLRKRMGKSGKSRVASLYNTENFINNYRRLYKKVVYKNIWQE